MENKMRRNKYLIIIMFVVCVVGIVFVSYNYVLSKIRLTFETVNLEFYGNDEPKEVNVNSVEEQVIEDKREEVQKEESQSSSKKYNANYFGYLEIPNINLKQGLVPMDSKYNNVDMNIQTIYPSNYPDVDGGNLILAAHSGTSNISYFKNLYKLNVGDGANVLYGGIKYMYNIVNIYTVPKNGEVAIYRNKDRTTLTLITCTKNDDTTQTVYILELISKEGV
ncbi:MAG: sortase [Bacilli bacterium]|nr:sortase [Bacilli bacterium]